MEDKPGIEEHLRLKTGPYKEKGKLGLKSVAAIAKSEDGLTAYLIHDFSGRCQDYGALIGSTLKTEVGLYHPDVEYVSFNNEMSKIYDRIIDIQKACLGRVLVRVGIEEVINGYYKAVPKETVVFREKGSKDFDDMTIDEKIELISFGPKAVGCSKPVKDLIFDIEDKKLVSPELAVKLLKAINEHYKQGECCTGREETLHTYCYAFGKAIREQCSKEQLAEIALTDPETFAKIFKGKNE